MKKVFLTFFLYASLVPCQIHSATSEEIKKFFAYDQGKLWDYYWVRPREMYDEGSNHSRFTTSFLTVAYFKKSHEPFLDGFKEYLSEKALSWKHELNYRTILYQSYQKEVHPIVEQYKVRENHLGQLEVVHKQHNFVIGTFDKNARYDYRGYNAGMVDLTLWNEVFYNPWDQRMYFRRLIPNENDRETVTDVQTNADQFLFRFKNDSMVRSGKIEVVAVPGFSNPIALFNYQGRVEPISKDVEIKMNWDRDEPTVSFDVNYFYDERLLHITSKGIVEFSKTLEEFMAP
ncbi:MAG: hypothetical protein HYY61_05425 [Deltaproteobacteria bacterium]|nr:hypothetical protein [Deltaproteobacteria bacterium]